MHRSKTLFDLLSELYGVDPVARVESDSLVASTMWWPPDAFGVAALLLELSGAYLSAVDPPNGMQWPDPGYANEMDELAIEWQNAIERSGDDHVFEVGATPIGEHPMHAELAVWGQFAMSPIGDACGDWEFLEATLRILAAADEACAGLGVVPHHTGVGAIDLRAGIRLQEYGTCSHVRVDCFRVLPKMRTPQAGIGIRSLSMNLSLIRSEVDIKWSPLPNSLDLKKLEILVLPWPLEIDASAFSDVTASAGACNVDKSNFGFFRYSPRSPFNVDLAISYVKRAHEVSGGPDIIVLPEGSLTSDELHCLCKAVRTYFGDARACPAVLAGVRDDDSGAPRNDAVFTYVPPSSDAWTSETQAKHHRWVLNESQIKTYKLGGVLHPSRKWWEAMPLSKRELKFFCLADWLVFCPLVCEDLARQDPVAQLVRSVGPNLVIALLLDGPQVPQRWSGRYATTLADDPGTSVLTVSPMGMVARSETPGQPPSRVVCLWKDQRGGMRPIELQSESSAILLTISAHWEMEWTADGRCDGGRAAVPVLESLRWF